MDLPYRVQILVEITDPELRDKILNSTPEEIEEIEHIWQWFPIEIDNGRVFVEVGSCWDETEEFVIRHDFFLDNVSLFAAIKSPSRLIIRIDKVSLVLEDYEREILELN